MPSIINGLFSGRSGISSHGNAIAVVGDNISNSSTIGFKASRAEFADLIAGGQTSGKVVGSGSTTSAVSTIFQQGTLEFTGRPLDLAIDGNGFFVVANGAQRFYSRAGNFKVNDAGYLVDQNDYNVLGFPANGTGALEPINLNAVSQDNVATTSVAIAGNLNASAAVTPGIPTTLGTGATPTSTPQGLRSYSELAAASQFSTVVDVFDSLGAKHTANVFFFKTLSQNYTAKVYFDSDDVDAGTPASGLPRQFGGIAGNGDFNLIFNSDGTIGAGSTAVRTATVPWTNGADQTQSITIDLSAFTQYSSQPNILSVTQDGKGIGSVGNVSITPDGNINALLSNGQSAVVGTIGLVNFSNPEGLTRIGKNLMQQAPNSGEPIVGNPSSGTFGAVRAGSLELSTVDIADQFVKLITLQRGFQANSRIITTINQLLNDIIQLV